MGMLRWVGFHAVGLVVVLGLRGDLYLLKAPRAAGVLAVGVALLALVDRIGQRAYGRLMDRGLRPSMLLWLVPTIGVVALVSTVLGLLWVPMAAGTPDLWKETLDLPPFAYTRLVQDSIILGFWVHGCLFARLSIRYVRNGDHLRNGTHEVTGRGPVAAALVLLVVVLYWRVQRPANMMFFQAHSRFAMTRDSPRAVQAFQDILSRYPGDQITDGLLFRIGRIQRFSMADREAARRTYRELLGRFPGGPYEDDVLVELGQLAEASPGLAAEALEAYGKLLQQHPGSPHRELALLGLCRVEERAGRPEEAAQARSELRQAALHRRVFLEGPDEGQYRVLTVDAALAEGLDRKPPE